MSKTDKIEILLSKMQWKYYLNHINSEDSFRTRYYHYLRVIIVLQLLKYTFSKVKPDINTCLDIGCNRGYYSGLLGEVGIKVDALDINLNQSKVIKHHNVTYFQTDFLDWHTNTKYDLILALEVYEHLLPQKRSEFIEKITFLLNDNGILLFSGPNCMSLYYGGGYFKSILKKVMSKIKEVDWHYRIPFFFYNRMLTNYNLKIIKWETNGVFPCFSNAFEKILNNFSLQFLFGFDKYASKFLKVGGANYICLLKGGEQFDR